MCGSIAEALTATNLGAFVRVRNEVASVTEARDALRRAQEFISEVSGPPESEEERERLTSTLHALWPAPQFTRGYE